MSWYKGGIEGLIGEEDIKATISDKRSKVYKKTVSLTSVNKELNEGWIKTQELKTRAHLEKKKPNFEYFQDLVWVMLAEMGFSYLCKDSATFRLPKGNGQTKQIDVFGIDKEDVVVIAECKAADGDKPKNTDFGYAITDIIDYKKEVTRNLNNYFETKPKYIFLFCTSNYIVGETDKNRMKQERIVWFDKTRLDYYTELTSQIGVLAKYQFLGEVLEGQDIPGLKNNKAVALKTQMGGYNCYSLMLQPSILLKIGYVLHRTENSDQGTYQRYVKKKRLAEVKNYILDGGFFPNSIIVNFDNELDFQVGPASIQNSDTVKVGTVTLPQKYKSAFIIDGQHRLYGYAGTDKAEKEVIPVIAFTKLPPEKQTNMFVDINTKAKQVKRNLLEALNGELFWNSPKPKYALNALNSMLALDLNREQDSPLFGLLAIGDESKDKNCPITLTYFIENAIKKENFFVTEFSRNDKPYSYGPLYDGDLADKSKKKAYKVITYYFRKIKETCPLQWEVLLKNVGIATLSWMLNEFLCEKKQGNSDFYKDKKTNEIITIINDRITLFCKEIGKREPAEIQSYLEGKLGYGGVDKARRHFERLMNEADPTFDQPGLREWIVEQSGKYSEDTRNLVNELSSKIIEIVEKQLKEAYGGEEYYLGEKIPESITAKLVKKKKELKKQAKEIEERGEDSSQILGTPLLELSDVREIALSSWTENGFDKLLGDKTMSGRKEERTEWLNNLVKTQEKLKKEEKLTMSDYQIVKNITDWFFASKDEEQTEE